MTRTAQIGLLGARTCICLALAAYGLYNALPRGNLMDFGSFIAAGRAAAEGLNPYAVYPLTLHVVLPGFESWNPNLNPPASVLLFEGLARFDPHRAFALWWLGSMVCYIVAVRVLIGPITRLETLERTGWALALAGFWDTLVLGQIYLPLVLAGAFAWRLILRRRGEVAGLLIGVVAAFKPNFLVWPLLLFFSGHPRPALAAFATAALVSAAPLLVYGTEIYRQWLTLLVGDSGRAWFLTNVSLGGLTARAGLPWVGALLGAILLAAAAGWAIRYRPSGEAVSGVALVVGLLASPIAWIHYTLFLLPLFARRSWTPPLWIAAALLAVPVRAIIPLLHSPQWVRISIGSIYTWAVIMVLVSLVIDIRRLALPPTEQDLSR